ncbi:hypothetical protein P152DRAFT_471480 [Eremomyces bilateralis CBS 781.70]|uniref:Uncharacterized protein n=1 Tax=Eremomyces bilateralis CBS 781.70 TaxID=1392243 RepID=A0A6G1G9W0_9PEZI|nr:uncharacterized protein P152DRAFT_471480 [Eremomyces bilateralis CBS 781.70]KAF1814814.1 hypothetical protein P152DRAFT_471480 [Eremomyces bilateralis CBS 781.70]
MKELLSQRYNGDQITEEMLEEASKLFSENYGMWSEHAPRLMGKSMKAGRPVRLSSERQRQECIPNHNSSYARDTVNGQPAGHAFACRWTVGGMTVCWITQLVVHGCGNRGNGP